MTKKYYASISFVMAGLLLLGYLSIQTRAANKMSAEPQTITIQNTTQVRIPPNPSMETIWNPVSLTSNSMSNYYIGQGDTTTFRGTVANYAYNTTRTVVVSVEIYNAQHRRIDQRIFENVRLQPFSQREFQLSSPRGLAPGMYYVAVGVYDAGNNNLVGWYPGYQWFTVAG